MKKKVFVSMMMAMALLAGGQAFAQSQTDGTTGATTQKECSKEGKACSKDGKECKKDKKDKKGQKGVRPAFNPFDGVQLTNDQKQRLQVLQQGLGPVVLTPEQQAKIKENPNLTPEQKKQLKAERKAQKIEAKKNYLSGVKEVLTPEQYTIFLENCYIYAPQKQMKDKAMKKGHKGPKAERKGAKDSKKAKGDKK